MDDAYISMRYARNWANGDGLVYNVGDRVEGFSNFLWTAVLSGASLIPVPLPMLAMIVGCALCMLSLLLTTKLCERVYDELEIPTRRSWLPAIVLALYPGWAYWAFSGMEGMLLTVLYLRLFLAATKPVESVQGEAGIGLLSCFTALTRWDGVVVFPAVAGALILYAPNEWPLARKLRRVASVTFVFAIVSGAYFACRWAYYDELLPNTFYAKTGGSLGERVMRGIVYTGELGVTFALPVTGIVLLLLMRYRIIRLIFVLLVLQGLFVSWAGGDCFPWLRFYLPVLPICCIMIGIVAEKAIKYAGNGRRCGRGIMAGALPIVIGGIGYGLDLDAARHHAELVHDWRVVGLWLQGEFPKHYRVAAAPIGAIGFYSDKPIVDILGLVDYETAHFGQWDVSEAPGHQKSHLESLLKRAPELVVGNAPTFDHVPNLEEISTKSYRLALRRLFARSDFRAQYVLCIGERDGRKIPYWIHESVLGLRE